MNWAPFVMTRGGFHPVVDRELLERSYPDFPLDVWMISSASDLLGWEKMRERYRIADASAVPCDVFVWGTGEPPDPRLTRIGGVPFLPKSIPWPVIEGETTTFLCQFDFRDSRDLRGQRAGGRLPGDLLLVFVDSEDAALEGDEEGMRFVWVSADETDTISASDVPPPADPFEFVTAWGARYRSEDVPSMWERAYAIPDDAAGGRCWSLPVLWGTKIGGVPYDSQQNRHEVPTDYLCQLTSVQASRTAWPWVDREEAYGDSFGEDGIHGSKNCFMIGDMGELTLYLQRDGSVTVESACG